MLIFFFQAPTSHKDKRIWFSRRIPQLYSRSSVRVNINCSTWGKEGTFRVFLRTNLTHMAVIGSIDIKNYLLTMILGKNVFTTI